VPEPRSPRNPARPNRSGRRAAAWAATLLLAIAAPVSARQTVDRILAVVGNELISYSDVLTHAELIRRTKAALLPVDDILAAPSPEELDRRVFKELVIRRIVYAEAVKLNLGEVTTPEVDAEYARLTETFASPEQYARFCYLVGLPAEQVRDLVRQYLVCRRYVEKKIGLQVRIGVKEYHAKNRARFGDRPLEEVRAAVEEALYAEKLDAWFADAVTRAKVKVIDPDYEGVVR
jgi:hypothetical protein